MSLPRFFLSEQVLSNEVSPEFVLRLDKEDLNHAKVLRLKAPEHIAVIDATSDYFECQIVSFDSDGMFVAISAHEETPVRPRVMLFQGLAKGDKLETVFRHCTELGVSDFYPLDCKRSVMKVDPKKALKKVERWQSIVKSAAMQSGQPAVAVVHEPMSVKQALPVLSQASCVLVAWEEAPQTCSLSAALSLSENISVQDKSIAVVVGPEGGISPEEVDLLLACNPNARLVTLGPSILRTETAGIVCSALTLYELDCLGDR